jgi:hypothetical protein
MNLFLCIICCSGTVHPPPAVCTSPVLLLPLSRPFCALPPVPVRSSPAPVFLASVVVRFGFRFVSFFGYRLFGFGGGVLAELPICSVSGCFVLDEVAW